MRIHKEYIRSSVFGFQDALVSTTGVVIGVSAGTSNKEFIILAALVTIIVEAISMGAGQFLSQRTLHQLEEKVHKDDLVVGAGIMFLSYLIGGIIPVLPIFYFTYPSSIAVIVLASLLGLFVLGYVKGKIAQIHPVRSAIEMLLVGGVATIIGAIAGHLLKL